MTSADDTTPAPLRFVNVPDRHRAGHARRGDWSDHRFNGRVGREVRTDCERDLSRPGDATIGARRSARQLAGLRFDRWQLKRSCHQGRWRMMSDRRIRASCSPIAGSGRRAASRPWRLGLPVSNLTIRPCVMRNNAFTLSLLCQSLVQPRNSAMSLSGKYGMSTAMSQTPRRRLQLRSGSQSYVLADGRRLSSIRKA
jgi:hypothetical protein